MEKPLINILTRTSNRPNAFYLNKSTIRSQTYKNIRHIVSVDDESTEEYVKLYPDTDYIFVNREKLIEDDISTNPNTGKYSPHNLYFNPLMREVKDGWVMLLDDDDRFANGKALETIVNSIPDEDTMVIWQMRFPNGAALPPISVMDEPPILGLIGSPCVLFHSKYIGDTQWDGWKCGDFRFITSIYNKIPKKVIIPQILVTIGQIGDGDRKDF
jgi:glycosyltransferase involved in cell wall biosynthesis